ncbi:MAG: hypothetical protein EOO89_21685 [Pedobacter sp.]|nr:MAG: hypothetical protein EOO89_21685 [Pedobacter sp.]
MSTDRAEAKKGMLATIAKAPKFHGAYHFLGIIYADAGQQDSAMYNLLAAVYYNEANLNKTKEMSAARFIDAATRKQDFEAAFAVGYEMHKAYPENQAIAIALKDACLWSYYIRYAGLNPNYLSQIPNEEYEVTSINQEYLITRKLKQKGDPLQVQRVGLKQMNNANYDVFKYTATDQSEKQIKFKLNWDMNTEFGGKASPVDQVIADKKASVTERLGAVLIKNGKADLKTEVEKLAK